MKSVLVTGANGQLGTTLRKVLDGTTGLTVYYTDVDTLDISNRRQLEDNARANNINIIVNCAAYTAVDRAEEDAETCMRINRDAVGALGAFAASAGIKVIHISTDYVFDGRGNRPYCETDTTNPLSVYGVSKLAGEQALVEACRDSVILRTSWLYSENGTNFVKTMLRLGKERDAIGVVADQHGTPTYAGDLAEAIKTILMTDHFKPGIYHYSNEGVCTWFEFAVKIFELAGIGCKVKPLTTAEYPTRAIRPAYSVLDKTKIKDTFSMPIPFWEESLKKCQQGIG